MRPAVVSTLALLLAAPAARADHSEWQLAVGAGAAVVDTAAAETSGTGVGFDVATRFAWGLTNSLDLGLAVSYSRVANVRFAGAVHDGQAGTLFADVVGAGLLAELRWTLGVGVARAFDRTRSYFAARAGGELVVLSAQELRGAGGKTVVTPDATARLTFVAGGAAGVEHRFGDRLIVALELNVLVGPKDRRGGLALELGWRGY
jgi:hypothetical protein